MKITAEEKIMYEVMKAIYDSGIPVSFKGSMVFKPTMKEAFWANHTPAIRKLTCTKCGHKGFCVEIWGGDEK